MHVPVAASSLSCKCKGWAKFGKRNITGGPVVEPIGFFYSGFFYLVSVFWRISASHLLRKCHFPRGFDGPDFDSENDFIAISKVTAPTSQVLQGGSSSTKVRQIQDCKRLGFCQLHPIAPYRTNRRFSGCDMLFADCFLLSYWLLMQEQVFLMSVYNVSVSVYT